MALNARQERFAQNVVKGLPQSRAYIEAGYAVSDAVAAAKASALVRNGKVAARISELRAPAVKATVTEAARWLRRAWAIAEQDKHDRVSALAQLRPIVFPDAERAAVDQRSLVFNLPDGTTLDELRALRDGLRS